MKCIFCGSDLSSVIDKRAVKNTGEIRRRRECLKCRKRYTTYERVCEFELVVIKRNGRREAFDRNKIRAGLEKALEKLPDIDKVDLILDKIERLLRSKGEREIESKLIGRVVLNELKKLDKIAYLRFVSVYRHFKEVDDFAKELQNLV